VPIKNQVFRFYACFICVETMVSIVNVCKNRHHKFIKGEQMLFA